MGYTSSTDEKGNTVIRDADGNVVEIHTTDGQRVYAETPREGLLRRMDAGPGSATNVTAGSLPSPLERLAERVRQMPEPVTRAEVLREIEELQEQIKREADEYVPGRVY